MKFKRATIHSFGRWTDTTFDFSNHPLTYFYGENEAGKSTLQQFLLYMLFGLHSKKRKQYRPKNRTEIGGTLSIYDDKFGMITIHRKEDECTCLLEDGSTKDEVWWKEQLSGLTKDVYTSIYAFSAIDLSHIQTMKAKDLSDVLFSVGLTGSTAIYEVEKRLSTKLDNLYRKRGQKPLLNKQINETAQAFHELQKEQEKEASYHSFIQQLLDNEERLDNEQKEVHTLQKENITNEKVVQMLPDIHQLHHTQEELAEIPDVSDFPKNGKQRLQDIKDAMLPLKSESTFIDNKLLEYEEKQQDLKKQLSSIETNEEAVAILEEQNMYEQRTYQFHEKSVQHQSTNDQYRALLYELEWDTNLAKAYSLPFHLETTWQELLDESKELHMEKSKLEQEQTLRSEKREQFSQEMDHLYDQLLPNEQEEFLENKLRQDKLAATEQNDHTGLMDWREKRKKQSNYLLYGSIIVAIIMLISAVISEQTYLYIFPILFIIIGVLQFGFTKQQLQTMSKMMKSSDSGSPLTRNERQSFTQQLQRQEENRVAIRHMKQELKQLEFAENQHSEAMYLYMQREKHFHERIMEERKAYPFLEELEIAHWMELLRIIRELQQVDRTMNEQQIEIEQLKSKNEEVMEKLDHFPEGDTFKEVQAFLDKQNSIKQFQFQYDKEMLELEDKKKMVKEKIEQLHQAQNQLFLVADVNNEEEYYEKADNLDKQTDLKQNELEITQKLRTIFHQDVIDDLLDRRPETIEVETAMAMTAEKLQEKQSNITEYHKQIAQLQVEIEQLEGKEDASTIAYRFQIEKDSLCDMQKEWSIVKLAYTALQKAKQAYQEKYITEVMKWTSEFFSKLTKGKYLNVFPPTETDLFQVEGTGDIRYTVNELSQGTIDQLYVSLRFAIAKVMRDTYQVPLLVDDAFVHFDDHRTEEATILLTEMAKEQQVLFFTCKQATAEKLEVEQMQITGMEMV